MRPLNAIPAMIGFVLIIWLVQGGNYGSAIFVALFYGIMMILIVGKFGRNKATLTLPAINLDARAEFHQMIHNQNIHLKNRSGDEPVPCLSCNGRHRERQEFRNCFNKYAKDNGLDSFLKKTTIDI